MMNFQVKENVTEYLETLQRNMMDTKEESIKTAGKTLAYLMYNQGKVFGIDEYGQFGLLYDGGAPFHSGALLSSAFRPEQQLFSEKGEQSILEIFWTGMYADYSWEEFRYDRDTNKPPQFDYAYYQETGDKTGIPHADSEKLKARHTGFFKANVNNPFVKERIYSDLATAYKELLYK